MTGLYLQYRQLFLGPVSDFSLVIGSEAHRESAIFYCVKRRREISEHVICVKIESLVTAASEIPHLRFRLY